MIDTLGTALKQARKVKGLTQEQLAAELFVTRQTVSNWENGRSEPDFEMLKRLATLLEMDLDAAFGQMKEEKQEEPFIPDTTELPLVEVVQPQPVKSKVRRVIGLSAALLCVALAVLLFAGEEKIDYSPAWFQEAVSYQEGHARINMFVRPNNAPKENQVVDGKKYWWFALLLREDGGVGIQVERLRAVLCFTDGTHQVVDYNKEKIASMWGSNHIDKYGLLRVVIKLDHDESLQLDGMGFHIFAVDDKDRQLEFRQYFNTDEL